jgi:XTP/dITP diphosphohydrolase
VLADTAAAIAAGQRPPDPDSIGDLLFAAVALAHASGVDAEDALRARSRRFRDHMAATEAAARAAGRDPDLLDPGQWRLFWRRPQAGHTAGR